MNLKPFILCLAIISLTSCANVEPTELSKGVTLVKPFNVKDCTKLGTTNVSIKQKAGIFTLDDKAATQDLVNLAKNRAGTMGGDSIVSKGPIEDGKMTFDIYKCGQ
jgi:hypothetical protein